MDGHKNTCGSISAKNQLPNLRLSCY